MRVYLDACAIIYAVEGAESLRQRVLKWIQNAESTPESVLLTSRLSRLECRVKPLQNSDQILLDSYEGFFARLGLFEITTSVIERATELRAQFRFKTPDAIHLATAIESAAGVFLTGDADLARCTSIKVELI